LKAKALPLDLALPIAIKAGTDVLGFLQNIAQSQPGQCESGGASGDKLSVLSELLIQHSSFRPKSSAVF